MSTNSLFELGKQFYERLNTVPAAARYLGMFDRSVEMRLSGVPFLHFTVRQGKLTVGTGQAPKGEMSVFDADAGTWEQIFHGQVGFYDAGGGFAKSLRRVGGLATYPDVSWVGILTRLAQENRL